MVEVTIAVSAHSMEAVLSQARSDMICIHVDSNDAARSIPADHLPQLVLQMVFTTFSYSIYIFIGQAGVVYTIRLYCLDTMLNGMRRYLETNAVRVCACLHDDGSIPSFVSDEDAVVLSSIIHLWKSVLNHALQHGPLKPLSY